MVLAHLPLHLREILPLYEGQVETGSHFSLKPELPASPPSHYPTHRDQASKIQDKVKLILNKVKLILNKVKLIFIPCPAEPRNNNIDP